MKTQIKVSITSEQLDLLLALADMLELSLSSVTRMVIQDGLNLQASKNHQVVVQPAQEANGVLQSEG